MDVEGIDRLYLKAYQPRLQTGGGVSFFFRQHRGAKVASTRLMASMSHLKLNSTARSRNWSSRSASCCFFPIPIMSTIHDLKIAPPPIISAPKLNFFDIFFSPQATD